MKRYAVVREKFPRQVVLLSGNGCFWKKCRFCDYHEDFSSDSTQNAALNREILSKVTDFLPTLEVIDSASFQELPMETLFDLAKTCKKRNINHLILETHVKYRESLAALREFFAPIKVDFIAGIETFDVNFRENVLRKGLGFCAPETLVRGFSWGNFLVGVEGQKMEMIERDVAMGLELLERITICAFIPNSTSVKRDDSLMEQFYESGLFSQIAEDERVEILDILDKRAPDFLGGIGYDE